MASLCLCLVDDLEPIAPTSTHAYAKAPAENAAGPHQGWWTMATRAPQPAVPDGRAHTAAYDILCVCLTLHIPQVRLFGPRT